MPHQKKNTHFHQQVSDRLGLLPNFFTSAPAAPGLIEELWAFAKSAYLDNPLPALFKERLFVYLSRFCPVRYCIVRHAGFLMGLGRPAGDAQALPQTVAQVTELLSWPLPDTDALNQGLTRLETGKPTDRMPGTGTPAEKDLVEALAVLFLEPRLANRARQAVRQAYGEGTFERLTAFLAFIRTAHYWTETHPELAYEPDMVALMDHHPTLANRLLDPSDAERVGQAEALRQTLASLQEVQHVQRQSVERYRTLFDSMDEGFHISELVYDETGQAIDWRFLEVNQAFEHQTGLHQAMGQLGSVIAPNTEPHWLLTYDQVVQTGNPVRLENYNAFTGRWYSLYASRVGDAGNRQFAVVFTDITERKRHEANLAFLAEVSRDLVHLKTITETMNALGAKIGRHFTATRCAFFEFNEAMDEALCEYDWHELNEPSLVGSYRTADFYTAEFLQTMHAGEAFVVTNREADSRADAKNLAALNIASCLVIPIVTSRESLFVLCITDTVPRHWHEDEIDLIRELTTRIWTRLERARADEALRQSEARLQLALDAAQMGTFVWYPQDDRGDTDARTLALYGLDPADALNHARGLTELVVPADRAGHAARVARALDPAGDGLLRSEYRIHRASDGAQRWIATLAQAQFAGEPPVPIAITGVCADVTAGKQATATLLEKEERQAFLLKLSDALRPLSNSVQLERRAMQVLGQELGVNRAFFATIDADGDSWSIRHDYTDGVASQVGRYPMSEFQRSRLSQWQAGRLSSISDSETDAGLSAADRVAYAVLGTRAAIGVPLVKGGRFAALLSVNQTGPRTWTEAELAMTREAAERTWVAIERAKAEEALQASQKRFESIANLVPDLLWDSAPDGATNWYNQRWLDYTGQRFEEAIGWGWTDAIYPDDRDASAKRYNEAVEAGTPLQQAHRIRRYDGTYRWFVVSTSPHKDARGQVVKMYGAATDIHERKLAQDALQESEERLRLAIEATELATWEWHLDTDQVYWNEQHFRLFGMEPPGHGGQAGPLSPDTFMRHVHPQEQPRIKELLERAIAERGVYNTEFCAVLEDGSTRWMSGYGRITEERDGQPVRMSGVMFDVDERRRAGEALLASEQKFRTLSDAAPALIWQNDEQGNNQFINQHFVEFVGLTPQQLEGVGWHSIIHPDDQQAYIADYLSAVREQRVWSHTNRLRRADGEWRWFDNYAQPLVGLDNQFLGHVGASVDITDRQQQAEALRVADQRKDEFLAMLAHELRNPMSTLRSGLGILTLTTQDEMIRSTVAMMSRQTDHLVRMVDDLLDVSRISRGKIELKTERVNLVELVKEAADSVRSLYQEQGKRLQVDLPASPIHLEGDATRLTQVVANLLTNGVRYTGEQGTVWLSLKQQQQEAVLSVRDNGIGLPADQLTAIFELFVQVDNSTARSKGGLGLGLTLVKRLVEMHGGRVAAQSDGIGKGSTFRVHLPTLTVADSPPPTPTSSAGESAMAGRVLVIDDNADAALMMTMLLKLKGYETYSRNSGRAGIEAAEGLQPGAILLDIGMPGMDGYETCRLLREQSWGQGIVVIALTGYGLEEDRQRTKEAGFDGHLVKPVDLGALTEMLTDLLDKGKHSYE